MSEDRGGEEEEEEEEEEEAALMLFTLYRCSACLFAAVARITSLFPPHSSYLPSSRQSLADKKRAMTMHPHCHY